MQPCDECSVKDDWNGWQESYKIYRQLEIVVRIAKCALSYNVYTEDCCQENVVYTFSVNKIR